MERKRILLVDDNPANLKLATYILSASGYQLMTAATATEALAAMTSFEPHVLLLDLQLPDQDGLSLARQLKSDAKTSHIPIVAVTAFAMRGDEEKARAAGVDDYITKPINKEALRAIVADCLKKGANHDGSQ